MIIHPPLLGMLTFPASHCLCSRNDRGHVLILLLRAVQEIDVLGGVARVEEDDADRASDGYDGYVLAPLFQDLCDLVKI